MGVLRKNFKCCPKIFFLCFLLKTSVNCLKEKKILFIKFFLKGTPSDPPPLGYAHDLATTRYYSSFILFCKDLDSIPTRSRSLNHDEIKILTMLIRLLAKLKNLQKSIKLEILTAKSLSYNVVLLFVSTSSLRSFRKLSVYVNSVPDIHDPPNPLAPNLLLGIVSLNQIARLLSLSGLIDLQSQLLIA